MNNAQIHGCKYEGWQCFHCGEIFTTVGGAEDHFGGKQGALTACQIKVGGERGLLMELRKAQDRIAELEAVAEAVDFYESLQNCNDQKVVAAAEFQMFSANRAAGYG